MMIITWRNQPLGLLLVGAVISYGSLACDLNVPNQYLSVGLAVSSASNGDVICVAPGVYNDAYFDLATKGLTLKGAQAGVDARTRPAKHWSEGDSYPAEETVFTHNGGHFFTIARGIGATVDGIFMPNMGRRAMDDNFGRQSDVVSLTVKNSIFKSTETYTGNQNGNVQFAAGFDASANNVTFERNYIETFTTTFLYAPSPRCNDWIIKDNEIVSYYFAFGPFAGDRDGFPGGFVIQGNNFKGTIPGNPPPRADSPEGYDALAFNAVLGNAIITENTFDKIIRGLGSVWLYDAIVHGNNLTDNYLSALALWSSDTSNPPKPPSSNVIISNNIIEYNGTPQGDDENFLSNGIFINRNAGGVLRVNASTIHINDNRLTNLGISGTSQVWAILQNGVDNAQAKTNFWGSSPSDINVRGNVVTSPWITSYKDDPGKDTLPGFWPIDILLGAPAGEPTPTPEGVDVKLTFFNGTTVVGNITFADVTTIGITTVTPKDPGDPTYVVPSEFSLGEPPIYYSIVTTAIISGTTAVCLKFPSDSIPSNKQPQLMHYEDDRWVDITTAVENNAVCGMTQSFSPFAVGYGFPTTLEDLLSVTKVTFVNNKKWNLHGYLNLDEAPDILASINAEGLSCTVMDSEGEVIDAFATATFGGSDCRPRSGRKEMACIRKGVGTTTFIRMKGSAVYKIIVRIRNKTTLVLPRTSETPLQVKLTIPGSTTAYLDDTVSNCTTRGKGRVLKCRGS
ncbi:elicitin-like protein 6 partial [Nannochloropsis oceanica]